MLFWGVHDVVGVRGVDLGVYEVLPCISFCGGEGLEWCRMGSDGQYDSGPSKAILIWYRGKSVKYSM